jgi:hypothetical protein
MKEWLSLMRIESRQYELVNSKSAESIFRCDYLRFTCVVYAAGGEMGFCSRLAGDDLILLNS